MTRVLVVEDDADLAIGLRNNLEIDGYEVDIAGDGERALELAACWRPDLLVLDLTLPRIDGMHVLRRLRERDKRTAVLILTARGNEADKVRGLRLGADDYVTKPFGLLELLARIESLLRRQSVGERADAAGAPTFRFGDIEVDVAARRVSKAGAPVALRPKEFALLVQLLRRRGEVVSRLDLMKAVWGYSSSIMTRTVDTHMWELRRKLETDPARPRHIVTLRGAGYRLDA
ncbi:response regulator transcription factor [Luteimonas salinilitoris]|uniref:Response regulator transcription factor n=1 Tax=Luteimonas salinilitoris TaxID=3237697 RepID=A0ABV4HRW6_9GAMM